MARVKQAGKTKTATGKPRPRKSAVKRPAPKPAGAPKPRGRRQKKPSQCWERTGKMGQKYVVCDTSKGQKGVYKPKKK